MLSSITRPKVKQFMRDYQFDLLVIGGGITGAGIALDAVTRGLSVALVDMQDFAGGYLQQIDEADSRRLTLFEADGIENRFRDRP